MRVTGDVLLLTWGIVVLFLPGGSVLAALRRVPWWLAVGAAPVVSLGLFFVTSVLTGVTGLPFAWWTAAVVWVVALVGAALVGRGGDRSRPRFHRPGAVTALGVAGVLAAVALGLRSFSSGLGTLSVLPQEHDVIIHAQLVARIARDGLAAPWQSFPADLVTGTPTGFYPVGFHQFAALGTTFGASPVAAMNGAMVVLLAVALPVSVAALGMLVRPASLRPVVAGSAAMVAAVSYRPTFALMHDGGILPNAAALAVSPALVALLLAGSRKGWPVGLAAALGVAGAVSLHPTSIPTVGLTVVVWLLAELASSPTARAEVWPRLRTLAVTGLGAVLLLVPFLLAGRQTAGTVTAFPRDVPVSTFRDALGLTFSAPYGGFFDGDFVLSQTWLVGLSTIGVAACLVARANGGLITCYVTWAGVLFGFLAGVTFLPLDLVSSLFYSSYVRISGCFAVMQWLTSGIAVAAVGAGAVRLAAMATSTESTSRAATFARTRAAAVAVCAIAMLLLVAVVAVPYARVNGSALAARYADPEFVRVDADDLRAAEYVAQRVAPGERVMNNANDGSTYGYVLYDVPLVENSTLGSLYAPYTVRLLTAFDEMDDDPQVRADVCRLRIGWAIVDAEAPPIWAPTSTYPWVPSGLLSVPQGLTDLARTPSASLAAQFGDVAVWRIDLNTLGCGPTDR